MDAEVSTAQFCRLFDPESASTVGVKSLAVAPSIADRRLVMARPRFHLAFPVDDLEAARQFYVDVLGADVGRTDARWLDFNFWDHQITAHLIDEVPASATNIVDQDAVPVRHFGIILDWADWDALARRIDGNGVPFLIPPRIRFQGQVGEQGTFFVRDPAGNALEFKAFRDADRVFAHD